MSKTLIGSGWLLFGYIICLPMQFRTPFGLRFAPSDLFLLGLLLLNLGQLKFIRPSYSIWHYGLPVIFAIATLVAVFQTGEVSSYALLQKDFGLLVLLVGYLVLTSIARDFETIRQMLRWFILGVAAQNLFAMTAFFSGIEFAWLNEFDGRLSGMLIDPNAYGGLLVVAFALHAVTLYRKAPLIGGWLGTLTTFTLAIGILLTFSRSSWIGMSMVLLTVIALRPALAIRIAGMMSIAVGSLLLFKGSAYIDVITQMATRANPVEARLDLIQKGLLLFEDQPLFGIGLGTFYDVYGVIIHNTPVWMLTEFGLVGMTVFGLFIFWFIRRGVSAYLLAPMPEKPLVLGLVLAHLAMLGLSLGIEALYQRHWWFVLALLASSCTIITHRSPTVSEKG